MDNVEPTPRVDCGLYSSSDVGLVDHIAVLKRGAIADVTGKVATDLVLDIGEQHSCSLGCQPPSGRCSNAAGCTGDDGNLSLKSCGVDIHQTLRPRAGSS